MTYDPNHPATPEPAPTTTPAPAAPAPTAWPASAPTSPVAASPVTSAPPPVLPAAKSKGSGGRVLNIILGVALAVAIGGVAFAVGRSTAPAAATTGRGTFANGFPTGSFAPNASGIPGFGGGRGGFGGAGLTIRGTVKSVDGDTVTIKTANGQTIEVTTGADTTYSTQTAGSASDVTNGASVQVQLQIDGAGGGAGGLRPGASGAPTGPVGTAGSITVIP